MKIADIFMDDGAGSNFSRPYLVAEAGVNHEGSMKLATPLN